MKTISETVLDIQNEVLNEDLLPDRAAELLTKLSALYGNILMEIQTRELDYNRVLLGFLDAEKVANRARIKAEISDEYQVFQKAKNIEKLATKMMSSLRTYIHNKQKEFGAGKNF